MAGGYSKKGPFGSSSEAKLELILFVENMSDALVESSFVTFGPANPIKSKRMNEEMNPARVRTISRLCMTYRFM